MAESENDKENAAANMQARPVSPIYAQYLQEKRPMTPPVYNSALRYALKAREAAQMEALERVKKWPENYN